MKVAIRPRSHILRRGLVLAAVGALLVPLGFIGGPSAGAADRRESLDVYTAAVTSEQAGELSRQGLDVASSRSTRSGVELDLVLSASEATALRGKGVDLKLKRVKGGKTIRQLAAAQAASGFTVWRSYDEPGGIRDEMYALARNNPQLVKLVVLGHTANGREIIALKVTQGARGTPDNTRPAVLYSSTQHAREWISTEVNRRLLRYFIDQSRANNKAVKDLLKTRELWFLLVANPDGYQYTFDHERLWRKNLRDNDGNGITTIGDGVDPNRNYPEHWNYDEEGSSSQISSDTYRGPAPGSEPETQAMISLYDRVHFVFQVNYHSAGQWLLYPEGWQIGTPSRDDPIYYALSGNLDHPAIPGFHPGLSSDVLYVTNGETTDFAHLQRGALAWTPELSEGCPGCGFVFPDDPALVQAEFERNFPFALSVARSAADPDDPVTSGTTGITTKPFYLKSDDTYKTGIPGTQFTFDYSYGDPQEVRVLAKRSLGAVSLKYQINGGAVVTKPTSEWNGGERYGGGTDVYYHVMRSTVTGTTPGDSVKVWFTGGGATSDSFTYAAVEESSARVLVLAAEDYTGASPVQTPGPHYLSYYTDALTANGTDYDVYDVDARGRKAPDSLGVLSHYDGVIWYTGDDTVTRKLGWGGGNADRLAQDEILEVRDFMNEGGRVFYTGRRAGQEYTGVLGTQFYDPTAEDAQCSTLPPTVDERRCLPLNGSGDLIGDVLQYWLGAYIVNLDAGNNDSGGLFDVNGIGAPLTGLHWGFNGAESAGNQTNSSSFITTSGILPPATYPQFQSSVAAKWDRPGGPFDPHSGAKYMYSQIGDISYKRLTRTITVPAGGADLSFWTSYNTEELWDHVFVEARTAGQDDWTTLPDANGHTSQDTGDSCPEGWRDLHPQLDHYQTLNADGTCSPTGTTGVWNAASGPSGGWEQWSANLSAYAGKQVEVSIAYASDWASQGLGVFVDDINVSTGEGTTSFEDDADPMDGWAVTGPPAGSGPNPNNFVRTGSEGFPEGAVVATPHSLYAGFGFEGITGVANRNAVMGRVLDHLLD
jgi:hypothetical protein